MSSTSQALVGVGFCLYQQSLDSRNGGHNAEGTIVTASINDCVIMRPHQPGRLLWAVAMDSAPHVCNAILESVKPSLLHPSLKLRDIITCIRQKQVQLLSTPHFTSRINAGRNCLNRQGGCCRQILTATSARQAAFQVKICGTKHCLTAGRFVTTVCQSCQVP